MGGGGGGGGGCMHAGCIYIYIAAINQPHAFNFAWVHMVPFL